ncbi:MAG: hypothetical protein DMG55_03590 [Acidobacteria bacterium]|nr:MAG: hypothetical protein DMG55_03590 [Acidobacteriota bacterium]
MTGRGTQRGGRGRGGNSSAQTSVGRAVFMAAQQLQVAPMLMWVLQSRVPQTHLLEAVCSTIPRRDFPLDYLRPERQWLISSAT